MKHENKKEAIASLHRERILSAAEELFLSKGYEKTTVDDISVASEYSRRTIYAYYESKDDILHHIIEKGLIS
ncbi:MAG: TetR/AcrR family transcriptional regulator, partial [Eubacteriales bacterium]